MGIDFSLYIVSNSDSTFEPLSLKTVTIEYLPQFILSNLTYAILKKNDIQLKILVTCCCIKTHSVHVAFSSILRPKSHSISSICLFFQLSQKTLRRNKSRKMSVSAADTNYPEQHGLMILS